MICPPLGRQNLIVLPVGRTKLICPPRGEDKAYLASLGESTNFEKSTVVEDDKTNQNMELPRQGALSQTGCPEDFWGEDLVEYPVILLFTQERGPG